MPVTSTEPIVPDGASGICPTVLSRSVPLVAVPLTTVTDLYLTGPKNPNGSNSGFVPPSSTS